MKYKQESLPVDERVADLLGRMNVREKIAQLTGFWNSNPAAAIASGEFFTSAYFARHVPDGVGSIGPSNIPAGQDVRYRNAVQRFLTEETRLGIPAIIHDEGCHGLMKPGATSFPSPIGLASSWNPDLLREIFDVVATEMRARGAQHALTPVIDVARDPRWGRFDETFGEDPFLNSRLGLAAVRGLQGSSDGSVDARHVMATLKHFVGHGTPEGGLNCSQCLCGPRELREVHLAPFEYVLREGRPAAVMPSYNEIDGIPSHANDWLLRQVLRQDWGFEGLIVSDYFGVMRLHVGHQVAATKLEAAQIALRAGVDLELPMPYGFPHLEEAVARGAIDVALIDAAVTRVLAWKFRLGLFENPFCEAGVADAAVRAPGRRALALRAAEEGIVLLKNDGDLLPLPAGRFKKIAVIGPNGNVVRLGGYSGEPLHAVSLFEGIKARAGGEAEVRFAAGCILVKNEAATSYDRWKMETVELATDDENRSLIEEARQLAAASDLVVLAVGETETLCREAYSDKVVGDAVTLDFAGSQKSLIEAVLGTGTPVVVYLMNGRPLQLDALSRRVPAIIEGWYMGQETGTAAARVIFGDVSPSGKLTASFPRSVGHIPAYYSKKPYSAAFPYTFSQNAPLFPFGHGLSYTRFSYSEPVLGRTTLRAGEETTVAAEITNQGRREADEIVQLYLQAEVATLTRPVRELKGFQRIRLKPGEKRRVEFAVTSTMLAVCDLAMRQSVLPGTYRFYVAPSSVTATPAVLTVTP